MRLDMQSHRDEYGESSVGLEPARTLTPDSELTKIPTSAFRDTGRTDQDLSQTETVCSPDHEVQRARDESDDVLQQSIRKSQHRPQPLTRRRRNLTSCLLCRSRKTKCDNKRPSCGYCILHGANCTYPDAPIDPTRLGLGIGLRALQASQDDVSNSVLLQRINHAVSLLESFRDSNSTQEPSTSPAFQPSRHLGLERQNDRVDFSAESAFTDDGFGRLEVPEAAARTSACESILQWPVLGLSEEEQVTSFPLQAAASESIPEQRRQLPLDQDSIWPLCQRFLILIHIKNPVLDVSEFKRYARGAAEYGPGWDGPGCLVLLACALACLTNPYNPTQVQNTIESGSDLHDSEISADGGAEANAEAFFNAAQRRLGLLPNSLIAIQCAYFAGLYEKFAIRPLDAWNRLQGACVRFQALLYAKALSSNTAGHEEQRARHIEQRLYWSCVKAECELRAEMQLPASGLLRFKYPDLFPALSFPPALQNSSPAMQTERELYAGLMDQSPASEAGNYSALEEERSWLYYLAEISLRNIMNRVLADFYGYGEVAWLNDTASLVKRHAAYSEELESWRTHLPLQLQFLSPMEEPLGIPEPPGNELSFFLQTRYLCVIEWLHRPFLYCIIYSNSLAQTSDYEPLIRLAQRGIEASCALIRIIAAHHRHGGIWSLARRSFGCSLLLIASARYNLQNDNPGNQASFSMRRYVRLPPGWRILVQITLATIRIWEGSGARDLQWMRKTLERLMELVKM